MEKGKNKGSLKRRHPVWPGIVMAAIMTFAFFGCGQGSDQVKVNAGTDVNTDVKVNADVDVKAEAQKISIYFFYNQPCATCDATLEFREIFKNQVGDIADQYSYEVSFYNTFKTADLQTRNIKLRELGYDPDNMGAIANNLMILDGQLCQGMDEIEKNLREAFLKAAEKIEKN